MGLVALLLRVFGCGAQESAHEHAVEVARQTHDEAHWGYSSRTGPSFWGELDDTYEVCGGGPYQSPVPLVTDASPTHDDTLEFSYGMGPLHLLNNGHTILLNRETTTNHIALNGHSYKLLQAHFHVPSEHTVDGEVFPMEMHLVHVDEFDHLAVVGVLFRKGAKNEVLSEIFEHLPASTGGRYDPYGQSLELTELLPKKTHFLHYLGSLTTPPCTENVQWLVLEEPLEASIEQIGAMIKVVGPNARPTQGLHHRVVTRNTTSL